MDPLQTITDNMWREVKEGRGLHKPDAATQVQIDDRSFELRLIWTVNQVESVGMTLPQRLLQSINGLFDT